jgi:hypothetical protein
LEVATISSQQTRSWQKIAALASQEKDPERMLELVQELLESLEERDKIISRKPAAKGETA